MENIKITNHQLYAINASISLGGSILVIASTMAGIAKQDAWMSPLIATVFGVLVMLMYYSLGSRYPGLTLIGMAKEIFGKWIGFAVSLCYIVVFIKEAADIPWFISSYFGRIMHETPVYFINLFYMAGIVIAILYGIEAIARASELFIFFVTVIFTGFIVMLLKNIEIEYITPVLENGLSPVLKSAYLLSCYITFSAINILMVFPRYVNEPTQSKKALIKGQLWSGVISFLTILLSILVLGYALTSKSNFPTLLLSTQINMGIVITRMEYIISGIWLVTEFMIGLFFFFSAVTSLSEIIGLKDHKMIVMPMGLIILILSGIVYPNAVYQLNWTNLVYAPLITTFGLIVPFLMMVVSMTKRRFFNKQ